MKHEVLKSRTCSIDPGSGEGRGQVWADAMEQIMLPPPQPRDSSAFRGSVSTVVSPQGIEFSRLTSSAQTLSGSCTDAPASLWVALLLEGSFLWGDDRVAGSAGVEMRPGALLYGPSGLASTLTLPDDCRLLYITVPQRLLHPRLLNLRSLNAGSLPSDSGVNRALASMLSVVADELEHLTAEEIRPIEVALSEFLIASLWEGAATRSIGRARAEHFHQICQWIEAELGDCDLDLHRVAGRHHASARYVQKLFSEAGYSFSHYLRVRRLERCKADLASRAHQSLTISEICFRWGFNDAAHFSRSFRSEYHTTPRQHRQQAIGVTTRV